MSSLGKIFARPFSAPIAKPPPPKNTAAARPATAGMPKPAGWQPSAATSTVKAARPPPVAVSAFTAKSATPSQRTAATSGPANSAAPHADLRLDVFNSDKNWKPFFTGKSYGDPNASNVPFEERVSQRFFVVKAAPSLGPDGAMYTETRQVVKATPEKVLAQLRDPHFWNNGSVDHWKARPDGSFTYALWPAGKMAGVKVNETMHPPERLADGSYVVKIDIKREGDGRQIMPGQAEGRAYIIVKPRPDGSSEVSGRFAGVQEFNPIFSAEQFAKNHLLGERGQLKAGESFINQLLPNGTGFGAMLRRAEQSRD